MVLVRQIGRLPLNLVFHNVYSNFIRVINCSQAAKNKVYLNTQQAVCRYLERKYGSLIDTICATGFQGEQRENAPIWMFWWQGEHNAPSIIRDCVTNVRKNAGDHPVYVIDQENYRDYIQIPDHIGKKLREGKISVTHLSDYLRMKLLSEYGGVWVDATVFVKKPFPEEIFQMPIWTVRNPGGDTANISNWQWAINFIGGWKGNVLFKAMVEVLDRYWLEYDLIADYFMTDCLIYTVCRRHSAIMDMIQAVPPSNSHYYFFLEKFPLPLDMQEYQTEVDNDYCFYKLSWKEHYTDSLPDGRKTLYAQWREDFGISCGDDSASSKKVSIIVPVYNVARYLLECLDSVIAQTYANLEIILVDDGSTDDSGSICDAYAQRDARLVVIHQKNAGAANAKNTGLDRATGEYITFIDSDDYVEPDWIKEMVTTAEKYLADVVECDMDKVYRNRSEKVNQYVGISSYTAEEYMKQYLGNWTSSLFCNKLFRAKQLSGVRFRKERRCIDDEFFTYKAVTGAQKIVRLPNILYHYRQRASSAVSSAKNRQQIVDDSLEILVGRYQWICKHFNGLRKLYLAHDADIMLYFARTMMFTKETAKKYRKIAWFYFRESIVHGADRVTLIYASRLPWVRLPRDDMQNRQNPQGKMDDYFV